MPTSETILLEAPLVDHAPPVVAKNPFKTAARKTKPATNQPRLLGTVQVRSPAAKPTVGPWRNCGCT
jgi:hypothetical protein